MQRVRSEWATAGLAVCIVVAAPLLGGTADRPYTLAVTAGCALAGLTAAAARPASLRLSYAGLALAVAAALCALQIVPLSVRLRSVLAPGSDGDLRLLLADMPPPWGTTLRPLSVDVGATLHDGVCLLGGLCFLLALSLRPHAPHSPAGAEPADATPFRRSAVHFALWGVAISAAAVSLLGAGAALGIALPPPVGVPGVGSTRALWPAGLHNSNHMAALCGLGALLWSSLVLDFSARTRAPRIVAQRGICLLAAVACNIALWGTLSRAGILTWTAAQLVFLFTRHHHHRRGALRIAALAIPLAVLGLFLYSDGATHLLRARFHADAQGSLWQQMLRPGSKVFAWREALPLLRGHLWLGVGHGAMENLFQHTHSLSGRMRFAYLENQWLQLFIDFGLPAGLALLGLGGMALRDTLRASHRQAAADPSPLHAAARIGLVALAAHNVFDFNLAVGGVALPALVLLSRVEVRRIRIPRAIAIALPLATLALLPVVWRWAPSHDEEGARLRALAGDPQTPPDALIAHALPAIARHPFDSYLSAIVAARLVADQHAAAGHWINRALLANPRDTLALRSGARWLEQQGHHAQAIGLLREALAEGDDEDQRRTLTQLVQTSLTAEDARQALSVDISLDALLDAAGTATPPRCTLIADLTQPNGPSAPSPRAAYWRGRCALLRRDAATAQTLLPSLLASPDGPPVLLVSDLVDLIADSAQAAGPSTADAASLQALTDTLLAHGRPPEWLLSVARLRLLQLRPPAAVSPGALANIRPLLDAALAAAAQAPSRSQAQALQARAHDLYGDLDTLAENPHAAAAHRQTAARLRAP